MWCTLPESPRWLITKGRREDGKNILGKINPTFDAPTLESTVTEIEKSSKVPQEKQGINFSRLRLPIAIAFLVAFFNQLSGINAILGYAPRIFGMTGIDTSASLINASLVTLVNLVFTLVGLRLIDKLGRRTLLYIGSFGYIISLGLCAWAFSAYKAPFDDAAAALSLKKANAQVVSLTESAAPSEEIAVAKTALSAIIAATPTQSSLTVPEGISGSALTTFAEDSIQAAKTKSGAGATIVLICILGFIAAHAVGQGAVIWVLISEIFPANARSFGQSLGCTTHWIFAALLTQFFVPATASFTPTQIFGFFCFMMVLHLIWVKLMVPETKNRTLEDLSTSL